MRWLPVVLLAIVLAPAVAAAEERADERRDEHLPTTGLAIEALADGRARVLGDASAAVVEIEADGQVTTVSHPDVGPLVELANPWILGRAGLLRRDAEGTWRRVAYDVTAFSEPGVRLDPIRPGHLAVVAPGQLVVVRMYDGPAWGTQVDVIDDAGTRLSSASFPQAVFDRPAPDGAGGLWVAVNHFAGGLATEGYTGHAHLRDGAWTLWQPPVKSSSTVSKLGPMVLRASAAPIGQLEDLVPDGQGGAMGHWYGTLIRITTDGTLAKLGTLALDHVCALAPNPHGFTVASATGMQRLRLSTVSGAGVTTGMVEVPLPAWYTSARFAPPLYHCSVAVAGEHVWLTSGPFVFHRTATGFTTLTSGPAARTTEEDDSRIAIGSVAPVAIPALAIAGAGIAGGGRLEGGSYGTMTGKVLAGTLAALPAALFLEVLDDNPCMTANDSDYQIYNDLFCVVRGGGYLVAITGAGATAGLGAYAAGEALDGRSVDRKRAFSGGFAGGMLGSLASIASTKLLRHYAPNAGWRARSILAATLIGTGAALGYQLAR